jgi:hypothetical protein
MRAVVHSNARLMEMLVRWEKAVLHPGVQFAPPGHFYSPLPSLDEVREREQEIFHSYPASIPGVEVRGESQLRLFEELAGFYAEMPFDSEKRAGLRYWFDNLSYPQGDAIFLYSMLRHFRPRRLVEVGSGFSSCVILDTNERFLANATTCTFIDPYPALLLSLLKPEDGQRINVIASKVQRVPDEVFNALAPGDFLIIDSSHVSKIGSDVNDIMFRILPLLQAGVHIHFHDVSYPFEYPSEWIYKGVAWTEVYLLHAFLQYNRVFEIELYTSYLYNFHNALLKERMPRTLENFGGSIWLRKGA